MLTVRLQSLATVDIDLMHSKIVVGVDVSASHSSEFRAKW